MPHHGYLMDALNIIMRFLHIISAVLLAGGAIAWRFAAIPATESLADNTRRQAGDAIARAWSPFVYFAGAGILISGIYNFLHKQNPPPAYHAIFGIKVLLALHVIAVLLLAVRPNNERRSRQLTGVVVSAIVIVILSAVLRIGFHL